MRGLSVAEQGLRFIWDCFVKYQGTWAYLLLGALAVVLVLLYRKKEAAFLFSMVSAGASSYGIQSVSDEPDYRKNGF